MDKTWFLRNKVEILNTQKIKQSRKFLSFEGGVERKCKSGEKLLEPVDRPAVTKRLSLRWVAVFCQKVLCRMLQLLSDVWERIWATWWSDVCVLVMKRRWSSCFYLLTVVRGNEATVTVTESKWSQIKIISLYWSRYRSSTACIFNQKQKYALFFLATLV